jgi:hypothetical protein
MKKQPLDHLRSRKKPVFKRVPIAYDSQQAEEATLAEQRAFMRRESAKARPQDQRLLIEAEEAEEEAEKLQDAVLENSAWFMVRSLGPKEYEEMQGRHTPTEEQRKNARRDGVQGVLGWNPDTFPLELIPACCFFIHTDDDTGEETEEQLTPEFVKEMYEGTDWNLAECNALLSAAVEVNQTRRVVDQGNASRRTRRS